MGQNVKSLRQNPLRAQELILVIDAKKAELGVSALPKELQDSITADFKQSANVTNEQENESAAVSTLERPFLTQKQKEKEEKKQAKQKAKEEKKQAKQKAKGKKRKKTKQKDTQAKKKKKEEKKT